MKLLTKEIQDRIPGLYETEDVNLEDKMCHIKYFAHWRWYAVEANVEGKDTKGNPISIPLNQFEDAICELNSPYKTKDGQVIWVDDIRFFGLVEGFEAEWGYFMLSELLGINIPPFGLGIERDLYTALPKLVSEVRKT